MSFSVLGKSKMEIDSVVSSSTPLPQAACLENSSGKTRGRGRGVSVEAASLLLCARFLQDLTGCPLKQFLLFLFFLLHALLASPGRGLATLFPFSGSSLVFLFFLLSQGALTGLWRAGALGGVCDLWWSWLLSKPSQRGGVKSGEGF